MSPYLVVLHETLHFGNHCDMLILMGGEVRIVVLLQQLLFMFEVIFGVVHQLFQCLALELFAGVILIRCLEFVQKLDQFLVVIIQLGDANAVGIFPHQLVRANLPVIDEGDQNHHADQYPCNRIVKSKQKSQSCSNNQETDDGDKQQCF